MRIKFGAALAAVNVSFVAALVGCGGSGSDPVLVANTDATVNVASTVAGAVANTEFTFPTGVPALGVTAATSLKFTNTATAPAFSVVSGSNSATGVTTFGSCIFAVVSSNFPAGHSLAQGQTVTVNPCSLSVRTTGAVANGQQVSRSVALLLGAAASANSTVTVAVTAGGTLALNGNTVGTVTLVPVSGA